GELQIVKGRDNYACDHYPGARVPTSRGLCRRPRGPLCQCPYVRAKTAALGGPIFCTNTAYFATLRHWHAEHLRKRRLLIIDEAHNLESQLVSVFTVAFPREQMQAWFGAALPRLPSADAYRPLLVEHLERLEGRRATIGRELEALRPPEIAADDRSEEHTSELQSLAYLVCRLLLEKKNEGKPGAGRRFVEERRHHQARKATH